MKDDYNIFTGPRPNASDSAARKQVQPAQTQALDNKVKASANIASDLDFYDPGPAREGNPRAITRPAPIASRTMPGNSSPNWPANKGSIMYYGKGSR
jgi:hypothetical protein